MKKKIDFGIIFICCIFLIAFYQGWDWLQGRPEVIPYGHEVYIFIDIIGFVVCNLSIGTAAAIIFYYVLLFNDKKKELKDIHQVKEDAYISLLTNFRLFTRPDSLLEKGKWEDGIDKESFIDEINLMKINTAYRDAFIDDLVKYFRKSLVGEVSFVISNHNENYKRLLEQKEVRTFKGSIELFDEIKELIEKTIFPISYLYLRARTDIEVGPIEFTESQLRRLAEGYLELMEITIELNKGLDVFIDSIEKKKILKFIKIVF